MNNQAYFNMKVIHKYKINAPYIQTIQMPVDAEILDIQIQEHEQAICIWAIVDTTNHFEGVTFKMYGTGDAINDEGDEVYLSTVQDLNAVWHVFKVKTNTKNN